ncbi:putative ankyrin repeat protein [Cotonvirus japonicus]|uniref:Ankyrin repeat protein n=1 Tax=Cotonvirus japonicus TaxID=2811091 RepID=A0ABM7NRF6_9VIRU|nr:putative ankyrin repeat protein [Cotonvirus japonicus]BCS82748.1 putative ankyrin repeat protein [Cotonvirus japonicus]
MSELKKFWLKVTNEKEFHHDHQYHDGLNVLNKPFDLIGSCVSGGLYFTSPEYINKFLHYGCNIRIITLPIDDPDFIMIKDPDGDKWRANKIILNEKFSLFDIKTYLYFQNIGVDLCTSVLEKSIIVFEPEYIKQMKYLIDTGLKLTNELYVNYACFCNNIDILLTKLNGDKSIKNLPNIALDRKNLLVFNWLTSNGYKFCGKSFLNYLFICDRKSSIYTHTNQQNTIKFAFDNDIIDINDIVVNLEYLNYKFFESEKKLQILPESYIIAINKCSKSISYLKIKMLVENNPQGSVGCEQAIVNLIKRQRNIYCCFIQEIEYLLKHGAKLITNDIIVISRFKSASRKNHFQMVKLLVENGIDLHINKDYALRWSARKGNIEIVKYLIHKGANVSAQNYYAIKLALQNKYYDVVEFLIDHCENNSLVENKTKVYLSNKLIEIYWFNVSIMEKLYKFFDVYYI